MTKDVAVVACTDKGYLPLACCALLTAFRQTTSSKCDFVLVGVDLDEQALEDLQAFERKHNVSFKRILIKTSEYPGVITKFGCTAVRLELDGILPDSYARAIYIDCDVLVLQDLTYLIDLQLGGRAIAAVEDVVKPWSGNFKRLASLGVTYKNYFNAGVVVFDLDLCRRLKCFEEARHKLLTADCRRIDQDALNYACRNHWLRLPIEWNFTGAFHSRSGFSPKIIHFTGGPTGCRPWHAGSVPMNKKYRELYIELLRDSNFSTFVKESSAWQVIKAVYKLGLSNIRRWSVVSDFLKWHGDEFKKR